MPIFINAPCVELLIVWIEIFKNKEESLLPFGRNYFLWHISCIQYKIFGFPLITARKRSLRKGNVFTYVCHSVHEGGVCHTPLGRHPPRADTPLHSVCGIQSPLPSACWDTPPAQCMLGYTPPVHAGIWSTSGQYASHWNAFLFIIKTCDVHRNSRGRLI